MAEDDWMTPVTKPRPGPVAGEAMQMSVAARTRVLLVADHNDGQHTGPIFEPRCPLCREEHPER